MSGVPRPRFPRWRLLKEKDRTAAGAVLREYEKECATACSRFLSPDRNDKIWAFSGASRSGRDRPEAVLLYHHRTLFPVINHGGSESAPEIEAAPFLLRLANRRSLYAVHGTANNTEFVVNALEKFGMTVWDEYRYDLMNLDAAPAEESLRAGPGGIVVRTPGPGDIDELYWLRAAYEREEVLPKGAVFNEQAVRLHLEQLVHESLFLIACVDGKIAGKICVNAESFTLAQIGGVYVLPEFRGMGIARRMTAEIAARILETGKNCTLFVKKTNAAARTAYQKAGFSKNGDYRICYY